MNTAGRKELEKATELISQAKEILEMVRDSEQEKFDNLPESLQVGATGEKLQTVVDELETAISSIDDIEAAIATAAE